MKLLPEHSRNLGLPYLCVALLLFISIFGIRFYLRKQNTPSVISRNFQKSVLQAEKNVKHDIEALVSRFDTNSNTIADWTDGDGFHSVDKKISVYVFNQDSLIFWSSNEVILPNISIIKRINSSEVIKLKNGWYNFQGTRVGRYFYLGSFLIKSEYPFQNEFLNNKFSPQFSCPDNVSINVSRDGFPIFAGTGDYLFSLNFSKFKGNQGSPTSLFLLLFTAGTLFFIYFMYRMYHSISWFDSRKNLLVTLFCIEILLLRILQSWFHFPDELYTSELFSPAWYSSTAVLPSIGDFTFNVILFLVVSIVIYKDASLIRLRDDHRKGVKLLVKTMAIFVVLCCFHLAAYMITDLVLNSSLSLNLQNISGLTNESGYGLFIVFAILFSSWLIATRVFNDIFLVTGKPKQKILSLGIAGFLYCLVCLPAAGGPDYFVILFVFIFISAFSYLKLRYKTIFSVHSFLIFVCFYAVFATFLLNRANDKKESEKRSLLSVKLATRRNPVTEILYEQLEHKLLSDSIVNGFLNSESHGNGTHQDSLVNHLKSQYLKDYWQKYNVQVTLCDTIKELRVQPQGYLINCNAYFRGIIKDYGETTLLPNLFFLDYGFGKEYYLAILSAKNSFKKIESQQVIIIEFNLINSYPDPGYPGLLMDNRRVDLPNLADYSYGLFQNGQLVHSVGSYSYRMELGQYHGYSAKAPFFLDDHMIHFQYPVNNSDLLLISKSEVTILTLIAPFSYLFFLFGVIALLITGIINFPKNHGIIPTSLRNRLHLSLIGVLVVTLLVIGIVQVINIININSKKNLVNLKEKAYSAQVEVQHRYSNIHDIKDVAKDDLEDFLIKLSNVFFTDINFYNEKGVLVASSRQRVFDEGLESERMNPEAYGKLILGKGTALIHNESIGSMHFSSAYLPLFNEQNTVIGYINLPSFSRQDELKKEISTFLVTFINIYILLIIFGVFITILISNYITSPLSMLAEKMSRLRLGIINEKIEWNQRDEIGKLVSEYNRMIDELGSSAEMLAQSERENAWREMARQVAHEIKNPLTPMKLSAQHLQKAWNDHAPDMDERLSRFTKMFIEQIDALSAIAADFSSFATMPVAVNEWINLEQLIQFILSMYKDTSQISYELHSGIPDPYIWADRALLSRIFTNLLNNAVQAIGDSADGRISIRITTESEKLVVSVSDNGSGIKAGMAEKIFQPNFTTKTGGMGLGLAIVKGIVAGMNGEISFTSEEKTGTTFLIKLPSDVPH